MGPGLHWFVDLYGGRYPYRITSYNVCYTKLLRGLPDPCSTTPADWNAAMPLHIQAYDDATSPITCLPITAKANSDVLVIRRAKTCVAGVAGCDAVASGKAYLQASS